MILSEQSYICSAGETFDIVALEVYGDEKYSCEILNANPALSSIPVFSGGEVLALPVVEMPEPNEFEYMPETAPWKE